MLTVLESINLSTEYLKNKGIESPRLNAELLLMHVLKCKRLDLYLLFERPLTKDETDLYRAYLKRRSKFEPLQYIMGEVEFYGLNLKVNPSVLIPRPETELLVETIITAGDSQREYKILDIGTGSGNIVISLAKHLPNSSFLAIDLSKEALNLAEENAELNSVTERISFKKIDILKDKETIQDKFDIIVSNPPYISVEEYPSLQPELRVYEPKSALTDYANGLEFYREILSHAGSILQKGGKLYFEMGIGQSGKIKDLFLENNFTNIDVIKDYQNIDRIITGELN